MDKDIKRLANRVLTELEKIVHGIDLLLSRQTQEQPSRTVAPPPFPEAHPAPPQPIRPGPTPWKTWLEAVGICAGIIYAIVTVIQWRDLRQNFEVDQRAVLKLVPKTSPWATVDELKEFTYSIAMSNIGKVPARDIRATCVIEVVKRENAPSLKFDEFTLVTLSILFNGSDDKIDCDMRDENGGIRQLTTQQHDDLVAGQAYMATFARADYRDNFGKHWTQFCVWKAFEKGSFQSRPCTNYNNVDTN